MGAVTDSVPGNPDLWHSSTDERPCRMYPSWLNAGCPKHGAGVALLVAGQASPCWRSNFSLARLRALAARGLPGSNGRPACLPRRRAHHQPCCILPQLCPVNGRGALLPGRNPLSPCWSAWPGPARRRSSEAMGARPTINASRPLHTAGRRAIKNLRTAVPSG